MQHGSLSAMRCLADKLEPVDFCDPLVGSSVSKRQLFADAHAERESDDTVRVDAAAGAFSLS
jgi:hypothetical protein